MAEKFCKDCLNSVVPEDGNLDHMKCSRLSRLDLVTGKTEQVFCFTARGYGDECGKEGKLFEPRALSQVLAQETWTGETGIRG